MNTNSSIKRTPPSTKPIPRSNKTTSSTTKSSKSVKTETNTAKEAIQSASKPAKKSEMAKKFAKVESLKSETKQLDKNENIRLSPGNTQAWSQEEIRRQNAQMVKCFETRKKNDLGASANSAVTKTKNEANMGNAESWQDWAPQKQTDYLKDAFNGDFDFGNYADENMNATGRMKEYHVEGLSDSKRDLLDACVEQGLTPFETSYALASGMVESHELEFDPHDPFGNAKPDWDYKCWTPFNLNSHHLRDAGITPETHPNVFDEKPSWTNSVTALRDTMRYENDGQPVNNVDDLTPHLDRTRNGTDGDGNSEPSDFPFREAHVVSTYYNLQSLFGMANTPAPNMITDPSINLWENDQRWTTNPFGQ